MPESWEIEAAQRHPYMVDTVDALPPSLHSAAATALPAGAAVQRGIFVPAGVHGEEDEGAHRVGEQALLFTDRGVLHVQNGLHLWRGQGA